MSKMNPLHNNEQPIASGIYVMYRQLFGGYFLMSMTTIEFSIPTDIYEQANDICTSCGLTLEEAFVSFLEATVACGDLPFPYTQQDIKEANRLGVKMI